MTVATDGHGTHDENLPAGTERPEGPRPHVVMADVQKNPRQALVEALATAVARGAALGDVELARVTLDTLERLLGPRRTEAGAAVLDLGPFRKTTEGRVAATP